MTYTIHIGYAETRALCDDCIWAENGGGDLHESVLLEFAKEHAWSRDHVTRLETVRGVRISREPQDPNEGIGDAP